MADRISEIGVNRQEDMALPLRKYKRRVLISKLGKLAKGAAAAAPVAVATGLAGTAAWAVAKTIIEGYGVARTQEEYKDLIDNKAKEAISGETKLTKLTEFRTQTVIPDANSLPNTVPWEIIEKLNGKDIKPYSEFGILNAPLIKRLNNWVPIVATINELGIVRKQILYGRVGSATETGAIVPNREAGARFVPISQVPKDKIGVIITLQNPSK